MGQEFEGDLSGSEFWGVDLTGSTFRDVNFTGASMHSVWLVDVTIDGRVERLVVNGVDVTDHVNANDPWQPLRGMLRPTDRDGLLASLEGFDHAWAETVAEAAALSDEQRHRSVGGEWSFTQTLRHLVFGIDKWFTHPVLGGKFHPIGLPNTGSSEFPWPGIDCGAAPAFDEAVAVRSERVDRIRRFLGDVSDDDLRREVEVLENGTTSVIECLYVVFEEAFEHLRYARRDLAAMG